MMIPIPDVLDAATLAHVQALVSGGEWVDGNVTSGHQAARVKRNAQLSEGSAAAREAGGLILDALGRTPLFIAAALPLKVFPPLFNRYEIGDGFGVHVDNAVRFERGSDRRIRSDLSATLFLSDPDSYDGGELVIEGEFGASSGIKLPAGHMILYPASSLHRVEPVRRGTRTASFFWIQSMVRDNSMRQTLFDLDCAIQALAVECGGGNPSIVQLTGVYHNLLRQSVET